MNGLVGGPMLVGAPPLKSGPGQSNTADSNPVRCFPLVGQFEYSCIRRGVKSCCFLLNHREYMLLARRLFLAIMCKHEVIHKTGST